MNKLHETKTKPAYSYNVQRVANIRPLWSTARNDRHSNYQSILSDLTEQIDELTQTAKSLHSKQSCTLSDITESAKIYNYALANPPQDVYENIKVFTKPSSVLTAEGKELVECKYSDLSSLNNRIELDFISYDTKEMPFDHLETSEDGLTFLIYVKRNMFLGIHIDTENELLAEDFYIKEKNFYLYGSVNLDNYFGMRVTNIPLVAEKTTTLPYVVRPGFYYLKLDLVDRSMLDGYTINIIANNAYPAVDKINYYDLYANDVVADTSYLTIKDQYIEITTKDYTGNRTNQVHESYLLLDEEESPCTPVCWTIKNKMLYLVSDVSPNKLYCYNIFPEGNEYIYEDNDLYSIDIVLEKLDYRPGDVVNIETRLNYNFISYETKAIRIKILNKEANEEFYIDSEGNQVPEGTAWRDLGGQMIRWSFPIENIGSYKIVCEALDSTYQLRTMGMKLFTVGYKSPYKVFDIGTGKPWQNFTLGTNPDNKLEFFDEGEGNSFVLNFEKDGYYFDPNSGSIWTNIETEYLNVSY